MYISTYSEAIQTLMNYIPFLHLVLTLVNSRISLADHQVTMVMVEMVIQLIRDQEEIEDHSY